MKKQLFSFFFLLLPLLACAPSRAFAAPPECTQEKPVLLLYYLPWCPYSQKVISYLNSIKKSVPLENLQKNDKGRDDLRRIGGKMQVPCLIINDYPLYESDAIIEWLSQNKECLHSV